MVKKLHESFKNLPKWITSNLDKYQLADLDKKGIDLYNCTYEEADDLRIKDNRWTDKNLIPVFLLKDERGEKLYIRNVIDPLMRSDNKYASEHNRRWIIDNSIHKGFINISANKKSSKNRYMDPRMMYKYGKKFYAGQRKDNSTSKYYSYPGRDKSGYEIPNPAKKLDKLYEFNLDNYADVLERYYNKLNRLKDIVFSTDIKSRDDYEEVLECLGTCINDYTEINREINKVIRVFNDLPEEERTPEQFRKLTGYMYYNRYINDDIIKLQELLKNI